MSIQPELATTPLPDVAKPAPSLGGARGQGPWQRVATRLRHDPYSMTALVIVVVFVIAGLLAPLYVPYDPLETMADRRSQGPSAEHWLGTDSLGRDLFSRVMSGARSSMTVGLVSVLIGLVGGGLLGLLAAYYERSDALIMRFVDILLAFPSILIALAVVATLGPGLNRAMIAVGIANIPLFARLTRGQVLGVKERDFIEAARSVGAKDHRIVFKHLLPNCLGVLVVYSTVRLGQAIMMATTLGFLGLGAQPPSPEWGAMVSAGRRYLTTHPLEVVVPSVAIFIVVICANLVGDGLRDALDPKSQRAMSRRQRRRLAR